MVAPLVACILALFPTSRPLIDWVVQDDGAGNQTITAWNVALGARPTQAQLNAVTQAQIDAYTAGVQAAKDAAGPDLATLRDQAQAALDSNTTFLAIASPTNAQLAAQVRALTQQQQKIIQALKFLAVRALT